MKTRYLILMIVSFILILAGCEERKALQEIATIRKMVKVDNVLWMTTNKGLVKYDISTNKATIFTTKQGLLENDLWALTYHEGNFWIGGITKGISKFDGQSFTHLSTEPIVQHSPFVSISFDPNNNLWVGGSHRYFLKYVNNSWEEYATMSSMSMGGEGVFELLYFDNDTTLWYGGKNMSCGIMTFPSQEQKTITYDHVEALVKDKDGVFWLTSSYEGFYQYKDTLALYGPHNSNLPSGNGGKDIELDDADNIWFGNENNLVMYDRKVFTLYPIPDVSKWDRINGIEFDGDIVWVALKSGKLYKFIDGVFERIELNLKDK